jgi:hypothetical protein
VKSGGHLTQKSSKFRNGMDLDKIYFDLEPDKLHLKISKFILGVIRKNCNFAILSELGRFPIYMYTFQIITLKGKFP